jgi:hypothetical protein
MSFALAIEILFAEIAVPALENDREESKLIVFAERWHTAAAILHATRALLNLFAASLFSAMLSFTSR